MKYPTLLRAKNSKLGKNVGAESNTIPTALFFSGGKNSFLALKEIERQGKEVVLFTIFSGKDDMLPNQGVSVHDIMDIVKAMKRDCLLVPQDGASNDSYLACIREGLHEFRCQAKLSINSPIVFAFGDISNTECRSWREEMFGSIDPALTCVFPIWGMSSNTMVQKLKETNVDVEIVRANDEKLVGNKFGFDFINKLSPDVSPLGELGEYDTLVHARAS